MQTFISQTNPPVHMTLLAVYKHPVDLVPHKPSAAFLSHTEMVGRSSQRCGLRLDLLRLSLPDSCP